MKQETLEEASWKFNPLKKLDGEFLRHAFKEGAKWQAERMYSEEEVKKIMALTWIICLDSNGEDFTDNRNEILKQFKNK
jgi:hypothetical protein